MYFTYGMHYCFNIVTGKPGTAEAVLIRGLILSEKDGGINLNGPAKICKYLGIGREHTGIDIFAEDSPFAFYAAAKDPVTEATPRIGIRNGKDLLWRYIAAE